VEKVRASLEEARRTLESVDRSLAELRAKQE
jgi:hypothetical protein